MRMRMYAEQAKSVVVRGTLCTYQVYHQDIFFLREWDKTAELQSDSEAEGNHL